MVNTFLVCSSFEESARALDKRRLGKQRVEAFQLLKILRTLEEMCVLEGLEVSDIPTADTDPTKTKRKHFVQQMRSAFMKRNPERKRPPGWWSHPALLMWIGHRRALEHYLAVHIRQWIERGYNNTMVIPDDHCLKTVKFPTWVNDAAFHKTHRQSLFKKEPESYPQFAAEGEFTDYLWP